MAKYHRAFGVYGIIGDAEQLVVTKKFGGPYTNRYDLPGGSLGDGEPLSEAIVREIHEETGLTVTTAEQLGTTSFRYPWQFETWAFNQHIAVFYRITAVQGQVAATVPDCLGQDSHGAVKLPLSQLDISNASPLVLAAKAYLQQGHFDPTDTTYATWEVLTAPVY
ncbi:NUDIX hydrolase [Lactiplantibacillus fabifermentans]|uniref:ADP-ribose pyrophosphatase n=2 Tax=Lactiplantibacillus fabifermentans TaxID=483011 RepID=A0A0R2NRG2_9LACO|nr:NUDIX hydrolase [Lactiplantibacillus fabifermentans]ETY74352.1 NUDIX hydrolase [Lactiplantibacillus fabifermentans T30PCM01]KRO28287.1 ADP-ribose pyrophosphatase [Lactiplantibacillus fabifermentans DSM 21115]